MNPKELPDFFIADIDDPSTVNSGLVSAAIDTLVDNQKRYLRTRSVSSIVKSLCNLAEDWLHSDFPFRRAVLDHAQYGDGFSPQTLMRGLDAFFRSITPEACELWLSQEFGHPQRGDQLIADRYEVRADKRSRVIAPELIVHFTPGTLPLPALQAIVSGLLVGSAQFLKLSPRGTFVPRMFAHSIYQREPKLGACLELATWPGGNAELEAPLLSGARVLCAAGADETLDDLRSRMPHRTPLLRYGAKVSFAYVDKGATHSLSIRHVLEGLADDITAWDQFGCLSPQVVYVQELGETSPDRFAQQLAHTLEARQQSEPRGAVPRTVSSQIAFARKFYTIRAQADQGTAIYQSADSTAWTVILDGDIRFQSSSGGRLIYVKGVEDLNQALHGAEPIQMMVSTVGFAATEENKQQIAETLANWGVKRICSIGSMQKPPLHWRHDGRPALGDLVSWAEWELD